MWEWLLFTAFVDIAESAEIGLKKWFWKPKFWMLIYQVRFSPWDHHEGTERKNITVKYCWLKIEFNFLVRTLGLIKNNLDRAQYSVDWKNNRLAWKGKLFYTVSALVRYLQKQTFWYSPLRKIWLKCAFSGLLFQPKNAALYFTDQNWYGNLILQGNPFPTAHFHMTIINRYTQSVYAYFSQKMGSYEKQHLFMLWIMIVKRLFVPKLIRIERGDIM